MMILLSSFVLMLSTIIPYFTTSTDSFFGKSTIEQKLTKSEGENQSLDDIDDEESLLSDDDNDIATDAKIHCYDFIALHLMQIDFPSMQDFDYPSHFGELMVPPPQLLA